MNIPIELLGYKGRLTHISSRLALPPWHKEDELLVHIEFNEPHPAGILSTAIPVPVKVYLKPELLRIIKSQGEKQLKHLLEIDQQEQEKADNDKKRRAAMEAIAGDLEELLVS